MFERDPNTKVIINNNNKEYHLILEKRKADMINKQLLDQIEELKLNFNEIKEVLTLLGKNMNDQAPI